MRSFLPRYEGVFSGSIFIGRRGSVVLSEDRMPNA